MSSTKASDLSGRSSASRKLVAVVYADMVGYSRLIGLDDSGTLERLRALRTNVIDPVIAEHGGRLVQTGGNSLLIVFDSIDGAVRCAEKMQQQVPAHDAGHAPDRTIRFRIGIDIGDAIADGTDLHGNSVNVAVRLQAECPPGGICASRAVRDHVHDRLQLAFERLGALDLKNIARPVEAFVLRPAGAAGVLQSVEQSPVGNTTEIRPLPDRPSIAVLAFTNMSGDAEQEYFSDGVADDIITELSRNRALLVIARNSSFSYKNRAFDVKQIAHELGVRYVLEGSVRRDGDRIRVTAQLIEAGSGTHIWAERYDRNRQSMFAIQDEITLAVIAAIGPAVADAEMRRAMRRSPTSLGAWDFYQQGLWHFAKLDPAANNQARRLFERAIELDPLFATAYAGLSRTYLWAGTRFLTMPMDEGTRLASVHARKAVELDPGDADAQAELAATLVYQGDRDNARMVAQQALAINPNCAQAQRALGAAMIFSGRLADGREAWRVFERLSPRDVDLATAHGQIAVSYYFERDYERCVETARRQLSARPDVNLTARWLAAALGQLGRIEEARVALDTVIARSAREFDVYVRNRPAFFRVEDHEHMLDGLRKAGWRG